MFKTRRYKKKLEDNRARERWAVNSVLSVNTNNINNTRAVNNTRLVFVNVKAGRYILAT